MNLVLLSAFFAVLPPVAKQAVETQIMIQVSVCEGDPLGSRKAGTIRSLAEPTLTMIVGQEANFVTGGQVPFSVDDKAVEFDPYGVQLRFVPGPVKEGKVRIDLTVSLGEKTGNAEDGWEVQKKSTRKMMTIRTGEIVKLRVGKGTEKQQTWVEFTVGEGHPLSQHELPPLMK